MLTPRSLIGRRRRLTLAGVAALSAIALGGCGAGLSHPRQTRTVALPAPHGHTQDVSSANFGYLWPLTVSHGQLQCQTGTKTVFVTPAGRVYALNREASLSGVPPISPIRAAGAFGNSVSLGALLDTALRLCS